MGPVAEGPTQENALFPAVTGLWHRCESCRGGAEPGLPAQYCIINNPICQVLTAKLKAAMHADNSAGTVLVAQIFLLVAPVPRPSGAGLFFSLSPAPLGSTGSSFAAQDSTIFSDLRQDAPGPAPTYGETCTTVLLPCGDGTVAPLRVLSRRD